MFDKMSPTLALWLKWLFFIPAGYIAYSAPVFFMYIGLTFLYYFLSGLSWWVVVLLMPIVIPVVLLLTKGLWEIFFIGFSLAPNVLTCWGLALFLIYLSLKDITSMCHPVSYGDGSIVIQLPCWAYVAFQIYIVSCLLFSAVVTTFSLLKDPEPKPVNTI